MFRKNFYRLGKKFRKEEEIYIVYDSNVAMRAAAVRSLIAERKVRGMMALKASEDMKTMDSVLEVCRFLMDKGASRNALLVGIGGGITTDICGCAASLYKRGIRVAYVPTSLLAMVDAAEGGKNGVNLDAYKNMIGTFKKPEFTFVCPMCLEGLPDKEYGCGVAEMLKIFLIVSRRFYRRGVKFFSSGLITPDDPFQERELGRLIAKAYRFKKRRFIKKDPYDTKGRRIKLNLGHTFAHAIEHLALEEGHVIPHGDAVAMGIILAARLESHSLAERLADDFRKCSLNVDCPYKMRQLVDAMKNDKKIDADGYIRFIVPMKVGKVEIRSIKPEDAVKLL
ncbi:MAG: 3-dehydroquinate synthase [Bacteroidales bacterium]|nr:3-dehydroquinate synthase [Bacteroidales bacterium]